MKTLVTRVLRTIGLVPAGQLLHSTDECRQLGEKVRALEERMRKTRADTDTWKQKHDELSVKLREWKATADREAADARQMREGAEHAKARAAEWKLRAEGLTAEKLALRARLEEAQRTAIMAREYVMAAETKLD